MTRRVIDVACLVALLLLGLAGLLGAFGALPLALAGVLGVALGTAIALAGARWRWDVVIVTAAVVAAYFLFFGALIAPEAMIARIVPNPAAWGELALAAVRSWRDVLTIAPPLDGRPALLAVPALLGLLGAVLAISFAVRLRRSWWALAPVVAVVVAAGLFGTADAAGVLVRGALLAGVGFGWAVWRTRAAATAKSSALTSSGSQRRLAAVAMVAVAVVGATALAPVTAADSPRYALREDIVPPFRLEDQVSPLQSYRGWVRDHAEDVMLTVSDLPAGARIRLAAMDGYDGIVYDVTEGDHGGSFVSSTAELPPLVTAGRGENVSTQITIGAYSGIWVPTLGEPTRVTFSPSGSSVEAAERATQQQRGLYVDPGSGVAVTTTGLSAGDTLTVTGTYAPAVADDVLAGRDLATLAQPPVSSVPVPLQTLAAEWAGDGDPITRLRTMQSTLASTGYFSHGLDGEAPSRSGHGSERLTTFLTEDAMVGDDEQYAAAMALAARQLGMPARVVLGFYPPAGVAGEVELTAEDLHVWAEVAFEGYGWVAFDPTPTKDREPQDSETDPKSNPKPQVLQPPPQPEEPAKEPPAMAQDPADSEDDDPDAPSQFSMVVVVVLAVAAGLLLAALPLLVIVAVKAARRRRRAREGAPVDRIAGGWHEVVDTATDLGLGAPPSATRRQVAALIPASGALALAAHTDAAVFGAGEPDDGAADAAWQASGAVVRELRGRVGWWARLRARVSLRSLRRGVPVDRWGAAVSAVQAPPVQALAVQVPAVPPPTAHASAPQAPVAPEETMLAPAKRPRRRPETPAPSAGVRIELDSGEILLAGPRGFVGRAPVAPAPAAGTDESPAFLLVLTDEAKSVSKNHLAFGRDGGDVWVEDLGSTNGSFLDSGQGERRLEPGVRTAVGPDALLRCGNRTLRMWPR